MCLNASILLNLAWCPFHLTANTAAYKSLLSFQKKPGKHLNLSVNENMLPAALTEQLFKPIQTDACISRQLKTARFLT